MSKHETPLTRKYWEAVGGLLIEEFRVVKNRWIDGVIVLNETTEIHTSKNYDISNKDIICIQTKARTIGMGVLGQAYFSSKLIEKHHAPKSIKTVVICTNGDSFLEAIAKEHDIEIIIIKK